MTERRESEEMSRAAQRMAEAAEQLSRSVARLTEPEAAAERALQFWEALASVAVPGGAEGDVPPSWGQWRIFPSVPGFAVPPLPYDDAVLLAVGEVREVREELWAEHEPEVKAPVDEDIELWARQREERREREGYQLP